MVMAIWNRRAPRPTIAESDLLREQLLAATVRLDTFVASLRMELANTEGINDERPVAGQRPTTSTTHGDTTEPDR